MNRTRPPRPRRPTRAALAGVLSLLLLAGCDSGGGTSSAGGTSRAPSPSGTASPRSDAVLLSAVHTLAPGVRVHSRTAGDRRSAPWLVYVHGGSWLAGRGDSMTFERFARHEFGRGYQVFSVDYRLSQVARWPAQRADVATGTDWILARSAVFGLDPARGAIVGESAGGHLAAVEAGRGRYAATVDLAGVADPLAALQAPFRPLGAAAEQLVGCAPAACPADWQSTRAERAITSRTPPTLIAHSVGDPVVPVTMSRAYAAALRAAGKDVTLDVVPGTSHGLLLTPDVLTRVDVFVDSHTRD